MLKRAASNAYSWWLAGHIRTKQSNWLDNDLQEMDEKVHSMMNLIEQDGDTFARRAELYFQRRPELSNLVEEMYKSYKALADRYDRISGELHKANHTIAIAFPDQVELAMQDDEDDSYPKAIISIDPSKFRKSLEVSQFSLTDEAKDNSTPKKVRQKRITSQISKEKAQEEIDRLQKEILVLQTEKEFAKSSYDSALARYLDIEQKLTELEEEFCSLQDAFSANSIIEDNEARALMVATAIKSCEDSLLSLQEEHKASTEETRIEFGRVQDTKQKLKALQGEYGESEMETAESTDLNSSTNNTVDSVLTEERLELQSICQKVKEHFVMSSEASIMELAERIDELVDKVVCLELSVSSHNAQINKLRLETDELQGHLSLLDEDTVIRSDEHNSLTDKLKEPEDKLQSIQHIEKCLKDNEDIFQARFIEVCHSLNNLSGDLQSPKYRENADIVLSSEEGEILDLNNVSMGESKGEDRAKTQNASGDLAKDKKEDSFPSDDDSHVDAFLPQLEEPDDNPDFPNLLNGLEGKQKSIFPEYTSILHNYKDTSEWISEIERQNTENHMETMSQVKELQNADAKKDEEIRVLKEMLSSLQAHLGLNASKVVEKSTYHSAENPTRTDENLHVEETGSQLAENITLCNVPELQTSSTIEDKFRKEIDALLEENLDFWLRFCTSYHQIQEYQTRYKDLKLDIEYSIKIRNQEGNSTTNKPGNQDRACKSLRELNNEVQVWLEKNALLNGELRCRFSSLCGIQDDISRVSKASETKDVHFTPYHAARFHGEVLNMQMENSKVAKELQAGLDFMRLLQVEIGSTLSELNDNSKLRSNQRCNHHWQHTWVKARIPLRTFLFGSKQKKHSIFS